MANNIKFIGFYGSTTSLSACAYTEDGKVLCAETPMQGATLWLQQPAFDLSYLPKMFKIVLEDLAKQSDGFSTYGSICLAWRPHDMVLLDTEGQPIIPALSWQCNVASEELEVLKFLNIEKTVGGIEKNFILPKLLWATEMEKVLREMINKVMTTADYIACCLTGYQRLNTSGGLNNGLLKQNKTLAVKVLQKAGIPPRWVPYVIQSGNPYPKSICSLDYEWEGIAGYLGGWKIMASLDDSPASALGCGLSDFGTIIVLAGLNGTVIRLTHNNTKVSELNSEFFNRRMLSMALADCGVRYDQFVQKYGEGRTHKELDEMANLTSGTKFVKFAKIISAQQAVQNGKSEEETIEQFSLHEKMSYIQFDIAKKLGDITYKLANEVLNPKYNLKRIILTEGLTKSNFFCACLAEYLRGLNLPVYKLVGTASYKAATYGALITAMVGAGHFPDLKTATRTMCVLKQI